jgi:hypothetical protein
MNNETDFEETNAPEIAIEELSEAGEIEQPKKRRGRPPRSPDAVKIESSKTPPVKPKRKTTKSVIEGKQIAGLHAVAAHLTGLPELIISEAEGELLAGGIQAVAEEYGLELSGKAGAAIQLFSAAAIIYLPRLAAIASKKAAQQKAKNEVLNNEIASN